MSEYLFAATRDKYLSPYDPTSKEWAEKLSEGQIVKVKVVKMRNPAFFRKWWALAKHVFDNWDIGDSSEWEYQGIKAQKNFEKFRKDLTVHAGWYENIATVESNGKISVRRVAKSIAWDKMTEEAFEEFYSASIDAAISLYVKYYTHEQLRKAVEEILHYA